MILKINNYDDMKRKGLLGRTVLRASSSTNKGAVEQTKQLRKRFHRVIAKGARKEANVAHCLYDLRKLILVEGLPDELPREHQEFGKKSGLRARVWKILLRVDKLDAERYIQLVEKGAYKGRKSRVYRDIRADTKRTFASDVKFIQRLCGEPDVQPTAAMKLQTEAKLSRITNALLHATDGTDICFVQGLCTLAGVFLYTMPELEAFYCLERLITQHIPLYYMSREAWIAQRPATEKAESGTTAANRLVHLCLEVVDPTLAQHIHKHEDWLYNQFTLSLNALHPPLDEVVKLWDFLFAFGTHLNVLLTVARVVLERDALLAVDASNIPNVPNLLKDIPVDADAIITIAVPFVAQIPDDLYDLLLRHQREPVQI